MAAAEKAIPPSSTTATTTKTATTTTTNIPTPQAQPVDYEATLTGVIALAALFSSCVEAFGLIHPSTKFDRPEQVLLAALGVQQARLLIWGHVVGISSPPASVTDRAVPKRPSAAYPDVREPTFFGDRDGRLEDTETRQLVENALSSLVDRASGTSRAEMMDKFGLRAPKKASHETQAALDNNRLEAFREKHELLKEVAETYAQISVRRASSLVTSAWLIADAGRFRDFVKLTQEKVDFLVDLLGVRAAVDRAMCMDIRSLGWHLSADRARIAFDVSKLRLIKESCGKQYPDYLVAVEQALRNIDRERQENAAEYNPYTEPQYAPLATPNKPPAGAFSARPVAASRSGRGSIAAGSGQTFAVAGKATNGDSAADSKDHHHHHHKSGGGLFGSLFKRKSATNINPGRSQSLSAASANEPLDPPRARSDAGPVRPRPSHEEETPPPSAVVDTKEEESSQRYVRSKSVGDILQGPINDDGEEETRNRLEQMRTGAGTEGKEVKEPGSEIASQPAPGKSLTETSLPTRPRLGGPVGGVGGDGSGDASAVGEVPIEAHDQYHGLGRQHTKTQWGGEFSTYK